MKRTMLAGCCLFVIAGCTSGGGPATLAASPSQSATSATTATSTPPTPSATSASPTPTPTPTPTSATPTPTPTPTPTKASPKPPPPPKPTWKVVPVSQVPSRMRNYFQQSTKAVQLAPGVWTPLTPGASVEDAIAEGGHYGWCASVEAYERKTGTEAGGACW